MNVDRRDFMKILSAGVVTATTAKESFGAEEDRFKRSPDAVGILYDATVCIGCKACEVGCKHANNLPPEHSAIEAFNGVSGTWDSALDTSVNSFIKIKAIKNGDAPVRNNAVDGFSFMRTACMHCVDPDCVSVCPTSALQKDPKLGIVTWDIDACCGCRYCQMACPFLIPKFEYEEPFPRVRKCFLCSHRVTKGGIPGCAEYCPTGATLYGKFSDILAEAKRRIAMQEGSSYNYPVHTLDSGDTTPKKTAKYINYVYGEKDSGGTQYIVLSAVPFDRLGLPKLPEYSSASRSEGLQHTIYKGLIAPIVLLVGLMFAAHRSVKNEEETE
ncbi:MAG TPA: hydrogenase 2 operon protein HybA [Caldithrix abyssi]|uniref:Hydrogenase 2 operon protein HybA n=1 Tax=Caldithrix abyssi TaxID=187145 RepID=A0A7V4WUE7_CALAY|nr:hydrogenase 2 operon protein HybA [Caldithrix abyssi]